MIFTFGRVSLWWKKNPVKGKICLSITVLHLLALVSIIYNHPSTPVKKNHKILVRTIKAQAPSISTSSHTPTKQVASPPVQKKQVISPPKTTAQKPTKEPPKKLVAKPSPVKKTPPVSQNRKPSPPPPPPLSQNLQKSLKEIEETIAKIATNNDKMSSKRTKEILPKLDLLTEIEEDYSSSLIEHLQEHLRLPDSGEVKIELTLRRDGSIETVKVLSARSEQNKKRLEEHLPRLQFPPFPKEEREKKSKVFILTFCNDF
ncbi:MAG: hypothetical protein V4489_02005 [Chlamydiota bacterium]